MNELEKYVTSMIDKNYYLIPNDAGMFQKIIAKLCDPHKSKKVTKVVALDMKGIMYGAAVAHELNKPFVPILKGGTVLDRFPTIKSESYEDYSGKSKYLELFTNVLISSDRVLLIDDWYEAGSTGRACISMIEKTGAKIVGISVVINQLNDSNEQFFEKYNFTYVVKVKPKK